MPKANTNRRYPLLVGFLLGLIQTGLFFQLTFTLSSGFTTYLLIVLCWLIGSAAGVYYVSRWNINLRALLIVMLVAYLLSGWLANVNPFNTRIWLIYAVLIGIAGLYPGVFFARASAFYSARTLFFWENNGFIAGLVITTILFMLMGRAVLWTLPVLLAAFVWLESPLPPTATEKNTVTPSVSHLSRLSELSSTDVE